MDNLHFTHYALRITHYVFLAIFCVLLGFHCSFAEQVGSESLTIAIIQPQNIVAYRDAVDGFLRTLKRKKSAVSLKTIVYASPEKFYKMIKQSKQNTNPVDLILTVGTSATVDISGKINDIPVVFAMVLDPESMLDKKKNVVGASLNIPPEFQLKLIKEVLPKVEKVGIIYDPKRNTTVVKDILNLAKQFDLKVKVFPVTSQKDIPNALARTNNETDALLGIVDNTVYTSQTAKFIISYTVKKRLPFVGISQLYVKAGALCSLVFDNLDIGRQAAELAERILSGTPVSKLRNTTTEKITIAINLQTAKIIGAEIPNKIQEKAAIIYE